MCCCRNQTLASAGRTVSGRSAGPGPSWSRWCGTNLQRWLVSRETLCEALCWSQQLKQTCCRLLLDLLQFGESGWRQNLEVHAFPRPEEVHHTVHRQLQTNKRQLKTHIWVPAPWEGVTWPEAARLPRRRWSPQAESGPWAAGQQSSARGSPRTPRWAGKTTSLPRRPPGTAQPPAGRGLWHTNAAATPPACGGSQSFSVNQQRQWAAVVQSSGSPKSLSSRSLTYFGAQVKHLDLQKLWEVQLLPDCHGGPEELEGDDHGHVLRASTQTQIERM